MCEVVENEMTMAPVRENLEINDLVTFDMYNISFTIEDRVFISKDMFRKMHINEAEPRVKCRLLVTVPPPTQKRENSDDDYYSDEDKNKDKPDTRRVIYAEFDMNILYCEGELLPMLSYVTFVGSYRKDKDTLFYGDLLTNLLISRCSDIIESFDKPIKMLVNYLKSTVFSTEQKVYEVSNSEYKMIMDGDENWNVVGFKDYDIKFEIDNRNMLKSDLLKDTTNTFVTHCTLNVREKRGKYNVVESTFKILCDYSNDSLTAQIMESTHKGHFNCGDTLLTKNLLKDLLKKQCSDLVNNFDEPINMIIDNIEATTKIGNPGVGPLGIAQRVQGM